jgi:hypothetical protein
MLNSFCYPSSIAASQRKQCPASSPFSSRLAPNLNPPQQAPGVPVSSVRRSNHILLAGNVACVAGLCPKHTVFRLPGPKAFSHSTTELSSITPLHPYHTHAGSYTYIFARTQRATPVEPENVPAMQGVHAEAPVARQQDGDAQDLGHESQCMNHSIPVLASICFAFRPSPRRATSFFLCPRPLEALCTIPGLTHSSVLISATVAK